MADNTAALELPIGVTESKVLQQIARIESQLRKAQNGAAENFIKANQKVANSFKPIETAASGMSNSTRNAFQNIGYQVQDMIVQIQGGQGVVRALGQQLPQLLGGFGLAGVALGTLAPLILGIGAALLATGNDAEAAEKQMKALASAIDALEAAQKKASTSSVDLSAQYGPMAQQARELYAVQKQLAELNLTRELNKTASMIGGSEFGSFDNKTADQWSEFGQTLEVIRGRAEALSKMSLTGNMTEEMQALSQADDEFLSRNQNAVQQLAKMQTMFGVSAEQAGNLAAAFQRLNEAQGADNISAAAASLREQLAAALKNMDGTNEAAVKLVEQLLNAEDAALRAKTVDIAGTISAGADQAKRLADELSRALTSAANLASQGLNELKVAQIENQYRKDPVGRAGALASLRAETEIQIPAGADDKTVSRIEAQKVAYIEAAREAARLNEQTAKANEADRKAAAAANKAASSARKKTDREAERDYNNLLKERDQLLQSIQTPAERYADQLRQIDELSRTRDKKTGDFLITEDQANEARDRLEKLQPVAQSVGNALRSAFMNAFDDASGALEGLAKQLAMMAVQMQLANMFPSVFGAGGLFGAQGIVGAATGGYISGAGTGTSDSIPARLSNGEYVVNARATSQYRDLLESINSGRALKFAGGGYVGTSIPTITRGSSGGGTSVQVIDQRTAGSPAIETSSSRGPDGTTIVTAIVKEQMGKGAFNGPMKQRYGVGSQKVMR